jgi:NADH-quinone oxidoreductase subunit C
MLKTLGLHILQCYRRGILCLVIKPKMLIFSVNLSSLVSFITFLKSHQSVLLAQLLDIWVVDYPSDKKRFEVNYLFVSICYLFRIIVKVRVNEDDAVPSIIGLYKAAGWLEREAWDMYGVYFSEHNDLRRILTDYGFNGFPLRKDFPLTGFVEVRYDDGEKRVVQEPVEVAQEFRHFMFLSPWENKKVILK